MKAIIDKVEFLKELDSKHGKLYSFAISYDDERAIYRSKHKDQKYFIPEKEAEFTEETMTYTDKKSGEEKQYKVIKPIYQGRNPQSNFGKALQKERTRYSGFAVSYAKDLVVAGRLNRENLPEYATLLFDLMVELDKSIE